MNLMFRMMKFPQTFCPKNSNGLVYCPGSINLKPLRGLKEADILDEYRLNALGGFKVVTGRLIKT